MTVHELIQLLQTMPQELPVKDHMGENINGCHINEEFYDGDYANPNCTIVTVVEFD